MKLVFKSIFVIAILISSVLLFTSCEEADGKGKGTEVVEKYVNVEVAELTGSTFTDYISILGTIKPINSANLSYLPGGIIKEILIDKGGYATKGDTILVIDNDVLKANCLAAKAQFELARITYEKRAEVFKEKVGSEFEYLQAKYNLDAANANFELVKAQLSNTYITAPFNGIVDAKYYEVGELAPPGTPIVQLLNRTKVKVEAGVPERYVGQIKKGVKANIYVETQKEPISGRVSFVSSSVITKNRTFPIEILIDDNPSLKSEMIAEVFIENGVYENLITIPDEVVSRSDDSYTVFVAVDGKAVNRGIEIMKRYKNQVAVSKGLSVGENLIVIGYQNLVDGENINVVK